MNQIMKIAMHFLLLLNSVIRASEEEIQLPKKGSLRGNHKNNGEYHRKIAKGKDLSKVNMKKLRRKLPQEEPYEDVETPDEEGDHDDMDIVATTDETFFGEEIDQNEDKFYGPGRYVDDEYYKVDDDNFDCDDDFDHQEYYEFIEEKLENKKDPSRTQQEDSI